MRIDTKTFETSADVTTLSGCTTTEKRSDANNDIDTLEVKTGLSSLFAPLSRGVVSVAATLVPGGDGVRPCDEAELKVVYILSSWL